jgi:nucleotide-binding universal stress UspA family protein
MIRSAHERSAARPVLVGHDGTARGDDAIALGSVLADLLHTPIDIVCVHPYAPLSARVAGDGWATMNATEARAALDRARERLAGRDAVTFRRIPASTPALGLDLAAEEADAELIVVGSTGRGTLARMFAGTTAEQLCTHAHRPVAVAPSGYASRRAAPRVIGVAYDDSPEARAALVFALHLSGGTSATVCAIRAFDGASSDRAYGAPDDMDAARDWARRRLEKAVRGLPRTVARLVDGHPAVALAEAGAYVDLLIMGSHARGVVRRALLGSVSSEVVDRTSCPVLVVPRDAT